MRYFTQVFFVAIAFVFAVGTAHADPAHNIPQENAEHVCGNHGGMGSVGAGASGCSWCGTKKCVFITCNAGGCSQAVLPATAKGGVPVNAPGKPGKPIQAAPITPGHPAPVILEEAGHEEGGRGHGGRR